MMVALLVLVIYHPGRTLVGPDFSFSRLSREENKALKNEKQAAKKAKQEEKLEPKAAKKGSLAYVTPEGAVETQESLFDE